MDLANALENLGVGLSRLLRYSFGGFLLVVLSSVVNPDGAKLVVGAISWQLAALSAFVLGVGLYAAHRSFVIHIHHLLLCFFFWIPDRLSGTKPQESLSPTRWLASLKVPKLRRISAYTALRHSDLFSEKERTDFDITHAELGLIVMISEGLLLAGVYAWFEPTARIGWAPLFILSVAFFVASYPGPWLEHRIECMLLRTKQVDVERILRDRGLIDKEATTMKV